MGIKDAIMGELNGITEPSEPFLKRLNNDGNIKTLSDNKSPIKRASSLLIESKLNNLFYLRDSLDETRAGLHASAIIGPEAEFCYRQQVLSLLFRMNQGEQLPVSLLRIFAAGESIHQKWQNLFAKAGIAVGIEARSFCEQYELYYTPDAIIQLDGKKYIVEIKSMNTYSYQKATSHPSGRKQMQLYMHLTGIRNGFVLAEDKNTQDWKPFIDEYDPEIVRPFLERLQAIQDMKQDYLKYGELPCKKCQNANTKQAMQCGMRDACFEIGMGRIKL